MKIELLRRLRSIAQIGHTKEDLERRIQMYKTELGTLVYIDTNEATSSKILLELYTSDSKFSGSYSLETFIELVNRNIYRSTRDGTTFEASDLAQLRKELVETPLEIVWVWKEIFGITLGTKKKIELGDVTIIDFESHPEVIEGAIGRSAEFLSVQRGIKYLAGTQVRARDLTKAKELASVNFATFESAIHLAIGEPNQANYVTLSTLNVGQHGRSVMYSSGLGASVHFEGLERYVRPIELDDQFFTGPNFARLFSIVAKAPRSDLEERITLSVQWVGQAIRENEALNGYLKAVIAMEILFQQERETPITPSITYMISETIAFILGNNYEERIAIEKEVKVLYGKRSSIVHSGNTKVSREDFVEACNYARGVLLTLLDREEYQVGSIKQVYDVIRRKKYA